MSGKSKLVFVKFDIIEVLGKIMKFRVKVIETGFKKDSFLPAVRSYRLRRICIISTFADISLESSDMCVLGN